MFNKEVLRSITGSPGRFLAIFAIVALGVGFYAGLRMTAPDMRLAADAFYDANKLMDLRVVSTMGLGDGDIEAIRDVEGVEEVMGARETDVIADIGGEPYTVRVHSLPLEVKVSESMDEAMATWDGVHLNDLVLAEGRLPADEGECVMSAESDNVQPSGGGGHRADRRDGRVGTAAVCRVRGGRPGPCALLRVLHDHGILLAGVGEGRAVHVRPGLRFRRRLPHNRGSSHRVGRA